MYLSRLTLDPRNRDTRRWLADCHRLHSLIMTGFPQAEGVGEFAQAEGMGARAQFGVLFRVDVDRAGMIRVLVQSGVEPRWAFETDAVSVDGPKPAGGFANGITNGRRYRFRLRANPTRRVHARAALAPDLDRRRERAEKESSVGKRVEIRDERGQLEWLERQGARHGFRLVRASLAKEADVPATSANPGGQLQGHKDNMADPLTFGTVVFEGDLEVTNAVALQAALLSGIGPGKAFGCGLLSLAPIG